LPRGSMPRVISRSIRRQRNLDVSSPSASLATRCGGTRGINDRRRTIPSTPAW
jgi:hypothetical protein